MAKLHFPLRFVRPVVYYFLMVMKGAGALISVVTDSQCSTWELRWISPSLPASTGAYRRCFDPHSNVCSLSSFHTDKPYVFFSSSSPHCKSRAQPNLTCSQNTRPILTIASASAILAAFFGGIPKMKMVMVRLAEKIRSRQAEGMAGIFEGSATGR